MATILKRLLYFWIFVSQLMTPHIPVKSSLGVKHFPLPEYTGATYHVTPPMTSVNAVVTTTAEKSVTSLTPPKTSVNAVVTTTAEKSVTSLSVLPTLSQSLYDRAFLLFQEYLRTFSERIWSCLPKVTRDDLVLFTTTMEFLLVLMLTWRTVLSDEHSQIGCCLRRLRDNNIRNLQERLEALELQLKTQTADLVQKLQALEDSTKQQNSTQGKANEPEIVKNEKTLAIEKFMQKGGRQRVGGRRRLARRGQRTKAK